MRYRKKIGHIVKRVNEARKSNGNNVRDFNFFKQKIVCADCGKTMYLYGKQRQCIAVYIRLSSEDNDVDGSIKPKATVSVHREC